MKICIRAEGGSTIGMGHVMRMLELAKILSQTAEVFFLSKSDVQHPSYYEPGIKEIKENGFPVIVVEKERFWEKVRQIHADLILTDSYDVDERYFRLMKKVFPFSAYMDDEGICSYFDVDILINQNPYAEDIEYRTNNDTVKLFGTKYLVLRDEFINQGKKKININIHKVMVTLGGSDNNNLTESVIKQLQSFGYNIRVVIGKAFIHQKALKSYQSDMLHLCYNANMSECMQWCDAAVTSCGTTIYEMLAMGVPVVGIAVVDNQQMCADYLGGIGCIVQKSCGDVSSAFILLNQNMRQVISKKGQRMVDGCGKYRIAKVIMAALQSGR